MRAPGLSCKLAPPRRAVAIFDLAMWPAAGRAIGFYEVAVPQNPANVAKISNAA
jgi:hypothetical protein